MYINYKLLFESGLSPADYHVLVAAKISQIEDMEAVLAMLVQEDSMLEKLLEKRYIRLIKGKKGDSELARVRIDKKGSELLENLSIPEVTQGDLDMYDYLVGIYISHEDEDRIVGNKKKVKLYCAILRNHLSLSLHQFYWLCWMFLDEYKFTKKLENVFFDSNKNRYGKFINNIEDSPLYQWYDENKDKVEQFWKNKNL